MLRGVDRLAYRVANVRAAARFWRETWGVSAVREAAGVALLKTENGTEILLHDDPDLPAAGVFLLVDDVRALHARREDLRLTFTARPVRVARGYRATVRDPFGTVLLILDRREAQTEADDVRTSGMLFPGVPAEVRPRRVDLRAAYAKVNRTADDLPYTPHFERLHELYAATFPGPSPDYQTTWRHLLNERKSGQLPKLGEAKSRPPAIDPSERARLTDLLGAADLKRRDRLPYTKRFDDVADAFNRQAKRPLAPHQLWRLIATLAK